jgi:hypothetical protein
VASGWYSKAIVKKVEIGLPYEEDPSIEVALCSTVAVPASDETDLISYTVGADRLLYFYGGSASSGTDTDFILYINGIEKERRRNAWTERNVFFHVSGKLTTGDSVRITAEHHSTKIHNITASLYCVLYATDQEIPA